MTRTVVLGPLFLASCLATAQAGDQGFTVPGPFDAFTTDELGNIYALKGDVLELYNAHGKRMARNSAKTFGRITVIDAFYSLKPMVFSRDQRQLAMLDNTLSLQGSVIDLPRNGFPWVTLACVGVQNSFWFFDERELSLTRVDEQLRPLASTGRLDQLLGFTPQPTGMLEMNNLLYVNDPQHGVLVFDLFAGYVRTLPVLDALRIEVRGAMLIFFKEGCVSTYDHLLMESKVLECPALATVRDARIEQDRLFALTGDGVVVEVLPSGQ